MHAIRNQMAQKTGTIKPLIFAVAVLLAIGVGTAMMLAGDAQAGLGRVVALGDSSASGPLLGDKLPGSPPVCDRTSGGYPELLIGQVTHDEFVNETCTGSTVSSLFHGSNTGGSWIRPQLDALEGDERIVLLTVGVNNAGFGEVVDNCLFHNQSAENVCSQTYVAGDVNALVAKGNAIGGEVGTALDAIHQRSPDAKVFLVGYLDIAPPDAVGCSGALWLTDSDAPVFDKWERSINDALAAAAAAHDANFVDVYAASAGHSACAQAAARWVNPFLGGVQGAPIHPNPAGAGAVAGLLLAAIKQSGFDPGPQADLRKLGFRSLLSTTRGASFTRSVPQRGGGPVEVAVEADGPVELKLERVTKGRLVGGRCRPSTRRNRRADVCTRHRSTGGWQRLDLKTGVTTLHATGRARGRPLPRGWYRVRMRSQSLPMVHSTTDSFKIVGRAPSRAQPNQ